MADDLVEERRHSQAIVDSSPDMLALLDTDFVYLVVNEAYSRAFDKSRDELVGRSAVDVFGLEFFASVIRPHAERCLAGETVRYEEWFDFPATGHVHMEITYSPFVGSKNRIEGFAVHGRDITERTQAMERLSALRRRNELLLNAAREGIYGLDLHGNTTFVNPAAAQLIGWQPEELIGKSLHAVLHHSRRDGTPYPAEECPIYAAFVDGAAHHVDEEVFWRKDGSCFEVEYVSAPICNEHGELEGAVVTFKDISARKQSEEAQSRLEERVQQTQKLESLGILAGGIAHDFNNLLLGILGNASLLVDQLSSVSPMHDIAKDVQHSATRAAELCRQMLAYSGKGAFDVRPVNLSAVVAEMKHLLRSSNQGKEVAVRYDLAEQLPAIMADVTQLRQIAMNLITNAVEATSEQAGLVAVSTGVVDCEREYLSRTYVDENQPEGRYVYLEVVDNGSGMDEETLARIFDPFFTTKFVGRGLGLAALLGIVRGHQGAIKVDSRPGEGSIFRVLFPALETEAVNPLEEAPALTQWKGEGLVLLVDDEETIRRVGGRLLKELGLTVITANDGLEAIEVFKRRGEEIRAVILDLKMPRLDGEQTLPALRAIGPTVPVFLSSGYTEQVLAKRFAGKSIAGFLEKPYTLARLQVALGSFLER